MAILDTVKWQIHHMCLDLSEGSLQTFQDCHQQFALWVLERGRVAAAGAKSC